MGTLNIGLAMVAARLATSEAEKELEFREKREGRASHSNPGRRPLEGKHSLPGAKLEVVKGKLTLIPSVGSSRYRRSKGWTLMREDGTVLRIDTGKVTGATNHR